MDQIDQDLVCIGCGAHIQTSNPDELGYTPDSALRKGLESGELYCQRCFRLRHYNEIAPVNLTDDDFRRLLSQISETDSLIVYVMDLFDVNGSLIPGLHRFIGDNEVLLVGNKEDILPKSLKRPKMKEWLRQQAFANGIRPIDVLLTSAKNRNEVSNLFEAIEKYRKGRDAYVVGVTNVGKSTLINQLIAIKNNIKDLITTSRFPGTTLDKIEIPFDEESSLIDTPGIVHREQMAHVLEPEDLKYAAPQKTIKPRVFQLNGDQTLFMGALARFDYQRSNGPVVAYFENNLDIHRTKLENADQFYEKHAGELLTPPTNGNFEKLPQLIKHNFSVSEKSDIVFEGLGWISVPAGAVITGWAPEGISVITRKAMI